MILISITKSFIFFYLKRYFHKHDFWKNSKCSPFTTRRHTLEKHRFKHSWVSRRLSLRWRSVYEETGYFYFACPITTAAFTSPRAFEEMESSKCCSRCEGSSTEGAVEVKTAAALFVTRVTLFETPGRRSGSWISLNINQSSFIGAKGIRWKEWAAPSTLVPCCSMDTYCDSEGSCGQHTVACAGLRIL